MATNVSEAEAAFWAVLEKTSAARKGGPEPFVPKTLEQKSETRSKDFDLWKKWIDGGKKPKDLDPLLDQLKPLLQVRAGVYKNRNEIPTEAIDFEVKRLAAKALSTYDPKKASIGTHVTNELRRTDRFIKTNQNFARIVEPISSKIGLFNSMKSELAEKLGREPSPQEIHDHALVSGSDRARKFSLKDIKRLGNEQRKSLISSTALGQEEIQPFSQSSRQREVLLSIGQHLTKDELAVHQYSNGLDGKPKLKPGEIAKKLGFDGSKVSKLRKSVLEKMRPYLGED